MNTERYVVIDQVCAWPNLTRLPDGSMVANIFNQPTHGGWEGDVECWGSEDEGRTWRPRGVPAPHEPGTNRMNVAAGIARDNSVVVLASGWSRRNPPGQPSSPHDGEILPLWVCRSADGGRTWTREEAGVDVPEGFTGIIPFGDVVQLADRRLGVAIYACANLKPIRTRSHFLVSEDDGRTWRMRAALSDENLNETALAVLPDGRLVAAARTTGDAHLELFVSEDHGFNWSAGDLLTLGGQHPGHLLPLRDGRLLLTYGLRNEGLWGVGARLSSDGGKTWSKPSVLADFGPATDGGYPSSLESEDGSVVTAYYCNRVPAHARYHMGVVCWKPPGS
jgi:hypothetical protein